MSEASYLGRINDTMYRAGVSRPGTYKYSNWSPELESYMAELYKTYGKTPFWSELMANPYLYYVADANHWDSYHFHNWKQENYPLAMQTIAGILQRANSQDYDSAINAVGRERLAGINADIAGNVGPGQAANPSDIPGSDGILNPIEAGVGEATIGETIANFGLNLASTVLQFVGGASSIVGQNINNAIGSVSAIDETTELFYKRLIDATPVPSFKSDMSEDERVAGFKQALEVGFNQMDWNGIPKKSKKYYENGFRNWIEGKADSFGFEKRLMNEYRQYAADKDAFVKTVGNRLYKDNVDDMISYYVQEIGDLAVDVQQAELLMNQNIAELTARKAGIEYEAYGIAMDDPNYVPNLAENLKTSPSVIGSEQSAQIAESGARVESAQTTVVQQQITREQKKGVKMVEKAFDKAIARVERSKRFRSYKPIVIGAFKVLKAFTMSRAERWVTPQNRIGSGAALAGALAGSLM